MSRGSQSKVDRELCKWLSDLGKLDDASGVAALLAGLTEIYGLSSIAYLGTGISDHPAQGPYLAVTYSEHWVERYKSQRFVRIDPTIQVGMRRALPIDWKNLERNGPEVRRLFGEAAEFGLGRQGISLPIHGQHGDRALLSITSDAPDPDWYRLRLNYLRDFQLIALYLHQAILRLEGCHEDLPALSPRERECLLWISEGKTYWECGVILGLSEHTVRCYVESARHKLGAANNSHAVNKASKAKLLSEIP